MNLTMPDSAPSPSAQPALFWFNQGLEQARLQHYRQAVAHYRQAIAILPEFPQAWHNLGLAYQRLADLESALACFDQALVYDGNFAAAYFNRGNVLVLQQLYAAALPNFDRAISLQPQAAYYLNRGNAYKLQGEFAKAVNDYAAAVRLQPDYAAALLNLGVTYIALQDYSQAIQAFEQVLQSAADAVDAHNNLGFIYWKLQQYSLAESYFQRAIQLKPDYAEAWFNLANNFRDKQEYQPAIAGYQQAIALKADFCQAYCNLGSVYQELKQHQQALLCFEQAISINSQFADAYNNKGNVLKDLKNPAAALLCYDKAIALRGDFAQAYYNRGQALFDLQAFTDAAASYDQAIRLDPEFTQAYWNNALLKLLLGEYEQGWRLYEWRWKNPALADKIGEFPENQWLGEQPLSGKTLLINQEQGLGDFIHFCRYAPIAAARAKQVVIEAPEELYRLIDTLQGAYTLVRQGEPLPEYDLYCPMMSMPLIFKTTLDNIPANVPYLFVDPQLQKSWRSRLGLKTGKRIGIVWAGSPEHSNDMNRSMPIEMLAGILQKPVEFHVLQKRISDAERQYLQQWPQVQAHDRLLTDFAETAALTAEMDLIISVDTSIAHLAGALAKPVWILLPYAPDFRWMLKRNDTPWYPSARLFRQPQPGDWPAVISDLLQSFQEWMDCGG